ncbi:NF038120 family PEP-CTERM protein [Roseateles toxinivorans]|uniref:Putative secreted protein n=1 Tax=Roseateles toxinivorans TaxID=270368 RepID=A0A4R6QRC3_9BURK|nr:NF038120 family PEP-CTERM protein [Roseateles toxinivorans]TDP73132.1 putative secreted protein [Roseateles toxinivorans]
MKKMLKTALATAALAGMGLAQAAVITFDGLADSPFATGMPLLGHDDEFYQAGYWLAPFSNQAGATAGDLVGAIVDGSDLANTCWSVACPTNNSSKFFTALNDGAFAMGALSGQGFKLDSFQASFVGAGGEVFPSTTLLLRIQGAKVGGGSLTAQFNLPGQSGGVFSFQNYATSGAFASQLFTNVIFYGLACNAQGSCSAFSSDKGQFALDNIAVTAVPEPSSWLMMGLGLAAFGAFARRRNAA